MKYLLLGEIQDIIIHNYDLYHQGMDFRDAATKLRAQHKIYEGTPEFPDFLSWDVNYLDRLKPLVAKIPVPLDVVMPLHPVYAPPVLINLEFYNPDVLKTMPYVIILYVISGSAIFYTKDDVHKLEAGSLLILSPNLPHRLSCTSNDVVVNIISKPDLFEQHFSQLLEKNELLSIFFHQSLYQGEKNFLRFALAPNTEILTIIKYLFRESVSTESFATEVFLSYLQILYSHILRNCDTSYGNNPLELRGKLTMLPSILLHLQRVYKTITLVELSQHFSYAPAYISRLIKKETGKNFNEIITGLKMGEAKQLLEYTELSIAVIATQVGYNSADHFTHSFKKEVGVTPRDYRKRFVNT